MATHFNLKLELLPKGITVNNQGILSGVDIPSFTGFHARYKNGYVFGAANWMEDAELFLDALGFDKQYLYEVQCANQDSIVDFVESRLEMNKAREAYAKAHPGRLGFGSQIRAIDLIKFRMEGKDWIYFDKTPDDDTVNYIFETKEAYRNRTLTTIITLDKAFNGVRYNQSFELEGVTYEANASDTASVFDAKTFINAVCAAEGIQFTLAEYFDVLLKDKDDAFRQSFMRQAYLTLIRKLHCNSMAHNFRIALIGLNEFTMDGDTNRIHDIVEQSDKKLFPTISIRSNNWRDCTFIKGLILKSGLKYDVGYWVSADGKRVNATYLDSHNHMNYHSVLLATDDVVTDTFLKGMEVNQQSPLSVLHRFILDYLLEKEIVKMPA